MTKSRERANAPKGFPAGLALPALGWLIWFLLIPLCFVVVYSFATRGPYGSTIFGASVSNYARAGEWIYLRIFGSSLRLALLTAFSCLVAGFPLAYTLARAPNGLRTPLLVAVVVPFWTNFVVRTYALKVLLAENGPVNSAALSLGLLREPFAFANSSFAVWVGMVVNYLPFMVLPLFVAIERFDFTLLDAARDLGASPARAFMHVLLPGVRAGVVSGLLFVFTPALGEFVIPDLLGGARTMLIGNVITDQFLRTRDWPFGSALSLLLIGAMMLNLMILSGRRSGRRKTEAVE